MYGTSNHRRIRGGRDWGRAAQCGLIAWGLRQMGKASEERSQQMRTASEDRNRQLDIMETGQREQSRIQADTLGQIGAALDHQGEVLAELLRRPA